MQMRFFIVAICFFLTSFSYAQKKDTVRKYLDQNFALTNRGNASYYALSIRKDEHYLLYAVYPDSTILLKAWFKDRDLSIKDGPYEFYFGKRKMAMKGYYVDNLQHGPWMFWYPNGILKDSGTLDRGQMVGVWKSWYETGKLKTVGNYRFDSSNNSYSQANGSTDLVPSSISGLKDGSWKFWFASGTLESEGEFKNDSLVNQWNWYRENGKPSTKEFYRGNKLVKME
jgi:antitoxin component YwqK of YwqJK toxin-antitoxin module